MATDDRDDELAREIRAHLELEAEERMADGAAPDDAYAAARRAFGNVTHVREDARAVWIARWIDHAAQDLRLALRMLARSRAFAIVVILTLALGIGATTAIFTVVNAALLRTLPVADPQQLVALSSDHAIAGGYTATWSYATWEQIRSRTRHLGGACVWGFAPVSGTFNLATSGEADPVDGLFVGGDCFTTLGVKALIGRTLVPADDGPAAVISYSFWQRRFGGAPDIIGRALVADGVPLTIVGVMPPAFFGMEVGRTFDIAVPIGVEPLMRGNDSAVRMMGAAFFHVLLRLKPDQTADATTAYLRGVQAQIFDAAIPPGGCGPRCREDFLADRFAIVSAANGTSTLREAYERPLWTLLAIVGVVLLIACANLASLMLARAASREREMSLRLALGAPRSRLARMLLIESLVLAGLGAIGGLIVAVWGSRLLVAQLSTWFARVVLDLSLDWRVLVFTAAVGVATAVIFGIVPALRAAHAPPIEALKSTAPVTRATRTTSTIPKGLVVAQVALSLMLVVAAALLVRTFEQLGRVPLGFDRDKVLVVQVDAARATPDVSTRGALYQRLVDAMAAVPGVEHAGGSVMTPIDRRPVRIHVVEIPGAAPMAEQDRIVPTNFITPGWLATYGSTFRAGRDFTTHDHANAPPVAIVNEAFVRRYFPDGHAIGRIVMPAYAPPGRTRIAMTIVGVVADAIVISLRDRVPPTMYEPLAQYLAWAPALPPEVSLSVRSSAASPMSLARGLGAALTATERTLGFTFRPLAEQVDASLVKERLLAKLSGFFGVLALLLAALGLYGVTAYVVTRRRAEIGIRMALGAQRGDVLGLVLRQSLLSTTIGMALGLAGAAATTRYLEAMLYGVTPRDATTFAAASVVFAAVATLAAFIPARAASTIDPSSALRSE